MTNQEINQMIVSLEALKAKELPIFGIKCLLADCTQLKKELKKELKKN